MKNERNLFQDTMQRSGKSRILAEAGLSRVIAIIYLVFIP